MCRKQQYNGMHLPLGAEAGQERASGKGAAGVPRPRTWRRRPNQKPKNFPRASISSATAGLRSPLSSSLAACDGPVPQIPSDQHQAKLTAVPVCLQAVSEAKQGTGSAQGRYRPAAECHLRHADTR